MVKAYENALPAVHLVAVLQPDDVESRESEGVFYNDLALALQFDDPKRANEYARQHLAMLPALLQKFPGNDDIADEAAVAHATMSALLERTGDRRQGLKEALESAEIREGVSARHPDDVLRRRLLMIAYGHVGDHLGSPFVSNNGEAVEAKKYFDKCVEIARGIVKADPQDRTGRYDLANALLRQGAVKYPRMDMAAALAELQESVAILESLAHEDPTMLRYRRPLMLVQQYVGIVLHDMGRPDEAMAALRSAQGMADSIMASHPGDVQALARTVRNEREMGAILAYRDAAGAIFHAQRGLSIAQKYVDGPESGLRHRYLGDSYYGLASVHRVLGHWQDAHDNARFAIDAWSGPRVIDVVPENLKDANAILAESAKHIK
jgi:tetratricopeptide (TPR) repeat protein